MQPAISRRSASAPKAGIPRLRGPHRFWIGTGLLAASGAAMALYPLLGAA